MVASQSYHDKPIKISSIEKIILLKQVAKSQETPVFENSNTNLLLKKLYDNYRINNKSASKKRAEFRKRIKEIQKINGIEPDQKTLWGRVNYY